MTGFAEKMDKLIFYDQILLADARYIGNMEDEIDRYIAYKIQRFMNKFVINPKCFIYYNATENEIRERMKAVRACNLNEYIVLDATYDEDGIVSNKHRHVYIMPNVNVNEGDFIWLYTKKAHIIRTTIARRQ